MGKTGETFSKTIASLPVWQKKRNEFTLEFKRKSEILFAAMYSLIEYSHFNAEVKEKDLSQLFSFAEEKGVDAKRQREIIYKIQSVCWNVADEFDKLDKDSFIDDYVKFCLQDNRFEPNEYKLLYSIGVYLNLSKEEISEKLRTRFSHYRYRAVLFLERAWVSHLITLLIVFDAILQGLMICPWFKDPYRGIVYSIDCILAWFFLFEIVCKIVAFQKDFFKETQNWFDTIIVVASLPVFPFRWLSALRVFRAMLLVNRFGQLKSIMGALVNALPNIGWVSVFLVLIYFIFAVLTTNLFGKEYEFFHSIERSCFSLFQLMTLESWPEIVYPIMAKYPYSWMIFIPFMVVTSYVLLNLVVGIIVTSMHDISMKNQSTEKKEIDEIRDLKDQMMAMSRQIATLQESIREITKK